MGLLLEYGPEDVIEQNTTDGLIIADVYDRL